jgi:hypothetical protein
VKTIPLFLMLGFALVGTGCSFNRTMSSARRGPVWVLPASASPRVTAPAPPEVDQFTNRPAPKTNQPVSANILAGAPAVTNKTGVLPPLADVLSLAEIKEMAGKGVSEQTLLSVLRASRAIYTLTTQDVSELQEAKVSRGVIDYLLSTPLLYKDDLLRSRAYYNYTPVYPGYWHWSFHDFHHDVHHYGSHSSYGHGSYHGSSHH